MSVFLCSSQLWLWPVGGAVSSCFQTCGCFTLFRFRSWSYGITGTTLNTKVRTTVTTQYLFYSTTTAVTCSLLCVCHPSDHMVAPQHSRLAAALTLKWKKQETFCYFFPFVLIFFHSLGLRYCSSETMEDSGRRQNTEEDEEAGAVSGQRSSGSAGWWEAEAALWASEQDTETRCGKSWGTRSKHASFNTLIQLLMNKWKTEMFL